MLEDEWDRNHPREFHEFRLSLVFLATEQWPHLTSLTSAHQLRSLDRWQQALPGDALETQILNPAPGPPDQKRGAAPTTRASASFPGGSDERSRFICGAQAPVTAPTDLPQSATASTRPPQNLSPGAGVWLEQAPSAKPGRPLRHGRFPASARRTSSTCGDGHTRLPMSPGVP